MHHPVIKTEREREREREGQREGQRDRETERQCHTHSRICVMLHADAWLVLLDSIFENFPAPRVLHVAASMRSQAEPRFVAVSGDVAEGLC